MLSAADLLSTPDTRSPWMLFPLPGKSVAPFLPVLHDGRAALRVQADRSVSILRQRLQPPLPAVGRLRFSWMTDTLPPDADVSTTEGDDSPVRVLLAFDGDRSRLSPRAHRMSELSRMLTGEELPYATLMYVWSPKHPVEAVVSHPRTDRIRKWVLETGSDHLGVWREHERDVRADFIRAFGEEPGPLVSVALMTDTDNTGSRLQAWYGPLLLTADPP